jgi:NADP-dependent 3-hydroxy acid dehydrogenase YdfG
MTKVIVVTGASSGIGFDAAEAFARQGHRVYAAARRVERMEPLKALGVIPLRMDVTDETSMTEGVRAILKAVGRIDALVNNAGYGYFGAIENVPLEDETFLWWSEEAQDMVPLPGRYELLYGGSSDAVKKVRYKFTNK